MSNLVRRMVARLGGLEGRESPGALPLSSVAPPGTNGYATDANGTLTAAMAAGGLLVVTALTAGRTLTTDTGVLLDTYFTSQNANANNNAFPGALYDLGIGESFELRVSNQVAFAVTWAGGVGVTITSTKTTTAASGSGTLIFTRTGVGTYNLFIL